MTEPRHVRDLLPAVVNGSANETTRAAVEAHLASCTACAAELAEWRQVAAAVREIESVAPEATPVLAAVWDRVDAGQPDAFIGSARARSSWSRVWRPVWSTAAVFVLVLALLVVERGRETPQEVLLAAAVRTTAQETATLLVRGSARFALDASGAPTPPTGTALRFEADIDGNGAVRFGEALHVHLELDLAGPGGVLGRSGVRERLTLDGQRYERHDDGDWMQLDDATGLAGLALLEPRFPELVLANALGAVRVDPEVAQLGGAAVRRYAFALAEDALPQPPGAALRYRAEVWIGEGDGLLHALRIRAAGPTAEPVAGRWEVDLRIDLVDFGAPVVIPSPGRIVESSR